MISLPTLADLIERYLERLVEESTNAQIEIVRSELAARFSCVPSQINYVLATRFTAERGFMVDSRRGGGGHVRIARINLGATDEIVVLLTRTIGDALDLDTALHISHRLHKEGLINCSERAIMESAIKRKALPLPYPLCEQVRACIMKSMVLTILRDQNMNKEGD